MTRHFEKRGRLRLYRKVQVNGPAVLLAFGMAGERDVEVRTECASPAGARAAAERRAGLATGAGFAEVGVGSGTPGVLRCFRGGGGRTRPRRTNGRTTASAGV
ncbi:MAG: hypothetical protein HYY17_01140 [Planctomycetes bacterium]|nr:hypothetical protein [Planctomycetota bacterium]